MDLKLKLARIMNHLRSHGVKLGFAFRALMGVCVCELEMQPEQTLSWCNSVALGRITHLAMLT